MYCTFGLRTNQLLNIISILAAEDEYLPKASEQDIQKALCKRRNETGGIDYSIDIKEHAKVMLTTNLDVEDRLINGKDGYSYENWI